MHRTFKVIFGSLVLAGLTACTSATPTPTPTPAAPTFPRLVTPVAPNYVTMNDTRVVSVPVSGSVFYNRDAVGQLIGPDRVSGRYSTSDGALILTLGDFEFVVKSGANGSGRLTLDTLDTNGNLLGVSTARIGEYGPEYQYVKSIYIEGPSETNYGVTVTPNWFGSIGIVTNPADMPTAGSATFTGGAAMNYVGGPNVTLPGRKLLLQFGTSAITADFASGTANVDMTFSSSYQLEYGLAYYYLKVTRVNGTGLQISGNSMSGGSWTALGGRVSVHTTLPSTREVPVDMVGRVLATSTAADTIVLTSSGSFYGYNSTTSGPAELTGRVMVDGYTTDSLGVTTSDGQADYTYWAIRQP